jgi:hypothetical protein
MMLCHHYYIILIISKFATSTDSKMPAETPDSGPLWFISKGLAAFMTVRDHC